MSDFDEAIERSHRVWAEFVKGNDGPAKDLYSHRADVTLANPFGPPVLGWEAVARTMERAASNYSEGQVIGFETVTKYATRELAYLLEVERYTIRIGDAENASNVELRVTSVFRPEDGVWKLMHRHADPITSNRPVDSVVQR